MRLLFRTAPGGAPARRASPSCGIRPGKSS